ncbi:ankyrin repeat protein [Colletotrichum salicis]|uniref:Ankyrin repeat protein n=1 Tax=Colletotrichum salicis TaxID=1209931 RepID=A0A135V447_9PEZI|nr:ankyrin repeat protein [Colletotrichum salicis]
MGFRSRASAFFRFNKSSPENKEGHPDAGIDSQGCSPYPEDTAGTTRDDFQGHLNAPARQETDSARKSDRRITYTATKKPDASPHGIKVLVSQPADRTGCVDIVAIHGLNGHREETWTDSRTGVEWLSDSSCLPKDMPTARVLTFGYNSKTYFSRSESDIPDFASDLLYALKAQRTSEEERQRRIVFICHSLGGLVFKQSQAVIMAHEQDRHYSCILYHIHGVVFFGTPHRGSSLATWDEIGTLIVKASTLGYSTNSKLSNNLKVDSKFLKRISESFATRGEEFEVRSFYETVRMKGLNCKVVEKESATLNWPKELRIASNANHSDICKFPSPEDSRYKLASQAIREAAGDLASGTDVPMACLRELNSAYEHHLDQIDNPISKTCEWVTSHTQWNRWDSLPGSGLLWITADAGCGKSVVAKYLVNFFRERTSRAHLHTHVCYFFFNEGLEHQDNAPSAVSAVLHQLLSNQRRLMHYAVAKYSSMPKNSFNRFSTLWSILLATMEDPQTKDVVWILDGLDECEDKSLDELIKALADFVQSRKKIPNKARPACKIILLSRHLNSIERRFELRPSIGSHDAGAQSSEGCVNFRLSAEEESGSVAKDIAQFVASRISDLGRQSEISTEILHRIEKRLISSADYTFLWVSLVMNIVKGAEVDGISMGQIEAILATTKLEDVYEKLLSGRASPLKTRKVLLLILSAVRPLTVEELCGAVEVNQDYYQQQDTEESKRALAHLDTISRKEQPGHMKRKPELETVHKSEITEATTGLSPISSPPALRQVKKKTKRRVIASLADANLYMLQICADYLDLFRSTKAFKKAALTRQEANVYLKDCRKDPPRAFLRYVSRHWLDHYRPIREDLKLSYDYLLQPNTPQFNAWIIYHGSWMPEEQRRILEIGGVSIIKEEEEELSMPTSIPYQASHSRVKTRQADANIGPSEKRERELQAALQHFNLIGREIDLYDEEFLDGKRYWKGKDYIESGDVSTSDEDEEVDIDMKESKATVPDRMQYYRQQQSRRVMGIIEEGRVSTSASMANPTSSRSWLA